MQAIRDGKADVCDGITDKLDTLKEQLKAAEDHIAYIDQRNIDNAAKLEDLKEKRCEANLLFVDSIMEHKQALEGIRILKEIIENMGDTTTELVEDARRGSESGSGSQLVQVYNNLAGMFHLMPPNLKESFLQIGAQFDIDPDFSMLKETNIDSKEYYAPKKFVLIDEAMAEEEMLSAEEEALAREREGYEEGYEDFVDDTSAREDVGDLHVDDKTDDMTMRDLEPGERKTLEQLKAEILALLVDLEAHMRASLDQL